MKTNKFRIWDKSTDKFRDNDASLHAWSNWSLDVFSGELIDYVQSGENISPSKEQTCYMKKGKVIYEPRYVLQQYTNLLDDSGQEIYEGDIVEINYKSKIHSEESYIGDVYWEDGKYMIGKMDYPSLNRKDKIHLIYVIGNVVHNPELLYK